MAEPVAITCNKDEWTKIASGVNSGKVIFKNGMRGKVLIDYRESEVTVTPAANTGDGTVTSVSILTGSAPKAGNYNLECVTAVLEGGVFKLVDPDGVEIESAITLPATSGGAVTYSGNGITFVITDGATDFIVGDKFDLEFTQPSDNSTGEPVLEHVFTLSTTNNAFFYVKPTYQNANMPDSITVVVAI